MIDSYNRIFKDKQKILVVLAHPDDMEICCGGLVARLIKNGKKVRSVVLTDGRRGMHQSNSYSCDDFAKIRIRSQKKAGVILGLKDFEIFNLQIPDGKVENSYENIGKVVYHVRDFKPDIVITHQPVEIINWFTEKIGWINHRDHRMTAELVLDSCYPYSIDHGFFPEQIKKGGLTSHEVTEFLFSDSYTKNNAVGFEISPFLSLKRKALEEHMSGGVLSKEEVNDFMDEIKGTNGNFEVLGYVSLS